MARPANPVNTRTQTVPLQDSRWAPVRWAGWLWWYYGEVNGEHDYDKYVAHLRETDPLAAIPTPRQYWEHRWHEQHHNPGARCC